MMLFLKFRLIRFLSARMLLYFKAICYMMKSFLLGLQINLQVIMNKAVPKWSISIESFLLNSHIQSNLTKFYIVSQLFQQYLILTGVYQPKILWYHGLLSLLPFNVERIAAEQISELYRVNLTIVRLTSLTKKLHLSCRIVVYLH